MRRQSWLLLLTGGVALGILTIVLNARSGERLEIPPGDCEIAWIHAATSTTAWERFVTGVCRLRRDWSELSIDDSRAFPDSTTKVPEIVISLAGSRNRVHLRWYKLAQGVSVDQWAEARSRQMPPPVAVIGGGSSDRAADLARAMAAANWSVQPLLFFTTASASGIADPNEPLPIDLMQLYPKRTFRMCFTNEQMAEAVINFVWSQPDLRPLGDPIPAIQQIGLGPWEWAAHAVTQGPAMAPSVSALEWEDDPYSIDLANQFYRELHEGAPSAVRIQPRYRIPYSVGGQYSPNASEAEAADRLLIGLTATPFERQILVLPTNAAPARRVLRSICGAIPLVGQSLVAVTGDSINLDNVYRDADIGWDVRSIPVPIVFFAHQNPVSWDWPPAEEDRTWPADRMPTPAPPLQFDPDSQPVDALFPPTKTDETLLHRDLVKLLVTALYGDRESPRLATDAKVLLNRIEELQPPVFDAVGNRASGRGEFIIVLRPQFASTAGVNQVLGAAILDVWTRTGAPPRWQPVKRLILEHGRSSRISN